MRIEQGGYRVYCVRVYGHIQGVGVTAYRIYWRGGAKC